MKQMTTLQAAIDFFGLKEGQTRMQFAKDEWQKLSKPDQEEIKAGLAQNGYEITAA